MDYFPTLRPHLKAVNVYVPGKPLEELQRQYGIKDAVKMASNENALGPSPKAVAAIKKALPRIHRYPEGGCHYLRIKLAARLGVAEDALIFGNGSDEVLVLAARAFAGPGTEAVIARPTFPVYEIACQAEDTRVVAVPVRKDLRYDLDAMARAVNARTRLVYIGHPDNPLGTYPRKEELARFLERIPERTLVVLDEAYYEFSAGRKDYMDTLGLLGRHDNLLITRTFSKAYGLGGLRVGYGVAQPAVIRSLNKVREPFNVNLPAQVGATAALDDRAFLRRSIKLVQDGRRDVERAMRKLGLNVIETSTNFMLIDLGREAAPVYERLLRKGVIVRAMGGWGLPTYIRVTLGKPSENKRFVIALKEILGA